MVRPTLTKIRFKYEHESLNTITQNIYFKAVFFNFSSKHLIFGCCNFRFGENTHMHNYTTSWNLNFYDYLQIDTNSFWRLIFSPIFKITNQPNYKLASIVCATQTI